MEIVKNLKPEPQMEDDEYVEIGQQFDHDEFACEKEIQDQVELVEHIDLVIPKWFYEVKHDDKSQWLPQINLQSIWSSVRELWILFHYKTHS